MIELTTTTALLAGFVAVSVVAGFLLAGLVLPAVGATGTLARAGLDFFDSLPSDLQTQPLSQQSTMIAYDGKKAVTIAHFYEENRFVVPLQSIAPVMRDAIVAIEDSRFYEHGGIDPRGVLRAFVNNNSGGGTQGASTLTQQYVKNVRLEEAVANGDVAAQDQVTARTYSRKIQEMKLAIALEKRLSKDEILDRYLNIALFGDSTYGIEAASRYFFNKHANQLTLPEAATLAGLVQSPTTYNPRNHPDRTKKRRDIVLERMFTLHYIDLPQFVAARSTPLGIHLTKSRNGCANAGVYAYFCDYVRQQIVKNKGFAALGKTEAERDKMLRRGGLTIVTTLNPDAAGQGQCHSHEDHPGEGPVAGRHGRGHRGTRHRQGARDDAEPDLRPAGRAGAHLGELLDGPGLRRVRRLPDRLVVQAVHAGHLAD